MHHPAKKKRKDNNRGGNSFYIIAVLIALAGVWFYISFIAQPYVGGSLVVHFIDVGHGDATLIRTGEGHVLIDGGDAQAGPVVVRHLRNAGVRSIEYVIATNPHVDNRAGGLADVLGEFGVGTIVVPRMAHSSAAFDTLVGAAGENGIPVRESAAGDAIVMGDAVFTVVAPGSSGDANPEDHSLSLLLSYGEIRFLFAGDARGAAEAEMLERGQALSAQMLRVGGHGSDAGTTGPFLEAVSPLVAIISVGAGNPFGYPRGELLGRLETAGVRVYRTDRHGTITASTNGRTITIR